MLVNLIHGAQGYRDDKMLVQDFTVQHSLVEKGAPYPWQPVHTHIHIAGTHISIYGGGEAGRRLTICPNWVSNLQALDPDDDDIWTLLLF